MQPLSKAAVDRLSRRRPIAAGINRGLVFSSVTKSLKPDERTLRQLYRRLGSVPSVAAELGVAYETARRWLMGAGVELRRKGRPSGKAERLDLNNLAELYAAGASIADLGKRFGVSPGTVRARLIEAGVELRPRPGWNY